MLFFPILPPRRPRRRTAKLPTAGPPPPAALTLVSATYDVSTPWLRLAFDRAISLAGLDGSAIVVDDAADSGNLYQGTGGAFLVNATTVEIFLADPTPSSGSGTTLTATASNGIVATNDGGTWAGVTGLTVPYP